MLLLGIIYHPKPILLSMPHSSKHVVSDDGYVLFTKREGQENDGD